MEVLVLAIIVLILLVLLLVSVAGFAQMHSMRRRVTLEREDKERSDQGA